MKKLLASLLAVVGLSSPAISKVTSQGNGNVMQKLRAKAIALRPEEIGINRSNFPKEVWGVLMETGYPDSAFSLVVLADGTASLYFSTGGGIIGAGQHETVRKSSVNFMGWANQYFSSSSPVSKHPLPSSGQVVFYFLSYKGVFSYSAKELELGEGRDKLSNLFHAGHEVISHMREIEQARHNPAVKN